MKELSIYELENTNGGINWEALLSCGTLAVGCLICLCAGPASIPLALLYCGGFQFGLIGSCISIAY